MSLNTVLKLVNQSVLGLPPGMSAMLNKLPAMMASMGPQPNSFTKPGNMEMALAFHSYESLTNCSNSSQVGDVCMYDTVN